MPPPSTTPPQLPLAANRAALSNQISLLLSRRTALLGSLTTGSRSPAGSGSGSGAESPATRRVVPDEDFKPTRPNDGVGYAPGPSAVDGGKTRDDVLRGRILGKRKGRGVTVVPGRAEGESESDDDEGRAAVGRPKKARVSRDGDEGIGESTSEKKKKKKG